MWTAVLPSLGPMSMSIRTPQTVTTNEIRFYRIVCTDCGLHAILLLLLPMPLTFLTPSDQLFFYSSTELQLGSLDLSTSRIAERNSPSRLVWSTAIPARMCHAVCGHAVRSARCGKHSSRVLRRRRRAAVALAPLITDDDAYCRRNTSSVHSLLCYLLPVGGVMCIHSLPAGRTSLSKICRRILIFPRRLSPRPKRPSAFAPRHKIP